MAYQGISTGTGINAGDGDTLFSGATKINENFQEIYTSLGDGSIINLNQKVGYNAVVEVPSNGSVNPLVSEANTLYILEGPSSRVNLNNLSSAPIGTRFGIISKDSTNSILIPSVSLIQGLNEDLTLDKDYISFDLVYTGSSFGWAIK